MHRCVSKQRDKINYFFKVNKTKKSRIAFGLAEIDIDHDGVADGDTISRSSDESDADSEARSIGSEDTLEDAPDVLHMWKVMLWKGTFLEVNDEHVVVEENKLKVDKKFCDEKSLK